MHKINLLLIVLVSSCSGKRIRVQSLVDAKNATKKVAPSTFPKKLALGLLGAMAGSTSALTMPRTLEGGPTRPQSHPWFATALRPRFQPRVNLTRMQAREVDTTASGRPITPWWGEGDYAEVSRRFRRTEFTHEKWVKHRSSGRFQENLATIFESGIGQNLKKELTVVTGAAVFVILLNCLTGQYEGFDGLMHDGPLKVVGDQIGPIALPSMPFSIAMSPLSLLLVFRTNAGYSRWAEARSVWGGIVTQCRNLARQAVSYFPQDERGLKVRDIVIDLTGAYSKALRNFLRGSDDDDKFREELSQYVGKGTMTEEQVDACMAAANRPVFLLGAITHNLKKVDINQYDRARMDSSVTYLMEYTGACERIFKTPVPLVYSRHTSRFLAVFLALLPLGLWEATSSSWNHIATLPAEVVLSFFLLGIEEIGMQIEEPFSILPLESFSNKYISATMDELVAAKNSTIWDIDLPADVGKDETDLLATSVPADVGKEETDLLAPGVRAAVAMNEADPPVSMDQDGIESPADMDKDESFLPVGESKKWRARWPWGARNARRDAM